MPPARPRHRRRGAASARRGGAPRRSELSRRCPIKTEPPRFIEVLGAPGVGKSTVLDAAASYWHADAAWTLDPAYPDGGPWDDLGRIVPQGHYEQAHPEFAALLFRAIARATLKQEDARAARMRERTAALGRVFATLEHAARRVRADQVLIVDEAFLKHASTLLHQPYSSEPLARTLHRREMPVGYVFAECPAEVACARIAGRPKRARSHVGTEPGEIARRTRRSVEYWGQLADRLERDKVPTLRLDTTGPPDRNAQLLIAFAERLAGRRRTRKAAPGTLAGS